MLCSEKDDFGFLQYPSPLSSLSLTFLFFFFLLNITIKFKYCDLPHSLEEKSDCTSSGE